MAVNEIMQEMEAIKALGGEPRETFATIRDWAEETFGPINFLRAIERADEEFEELLEECSLAFLGRRDKDIDEEAIKKEAADVIICLARIPDIWEVVEKKMAVNRQRRWQKMGDGTGYHIKENK